MGLSLHYARRVRVHREPAVTAFGYESTRVLSISNSPVDALGLWASSQQYP
ncbi:hypothetical protein ACFVFF_09470 [Streptomyces sp. NPDC057680]|uniref:hypothetical protein n=1 Tax=Streptomyces sp. NPDC057680 TaxID=3346208 RepID=UPI0036ACE0E4